MDHGYMNERLVIVGNKEYVQEWSCEKNVLKKNTLHLSNRICYAGLLLAPAELSSLVYSLNKLEVHQESATVAVG